MLQVRPVLPHVPHSANTPFYCSQPKRVSSGSQPPWFRQTNKRNKTVSVEATNATAPPRVANRSSVSAKSPTAVRSATRPAAGPRKARVRAATASVGPTITTHCAMRPPPPTPSRSMAFSDMGRVVAKRGFAAIQAITATGKWAVRADAGGAMTMTRPLRRRRPPRGL